MSFALVLLVAALLVATVGPLALDSVCRSTNRPAVALVAWLSGVGAVPVFVVAAMTMLLWPEHPPIEQAVDAVLGCLSAFHHGSGPWLADSMAILVALGATAALARATMCSHRHGVIVRRVRRHHRDTLSVVAHRGGEDDVMRLEHPVPLAYAVAGRPGFVVLTDGLCAMLTDHERAAVLAHERAHLRGRHHRIAACCEVLASALPFVPLFVRAPAAVRTLLELLADQDAARATSPAAVRSALSTVTTAGTPPGPPWSLGGGVDTALRLTRLATPTPSRPSGLVCLSAAMAMLALPALAATGVVAVSSVSTCLLLS